MKNMIAISESATPNQDDPWVASFGFSREDAVRTVLSFFPGTTVNRHDFGATFVSRVRSDKKGAYLQLHLEASGNSSLGLRVITPSQVAGSPTVRYLTIDKAKGGGLKEGLSTACRSLHAEFTETHAELGGILHHPPK